MLFFWRQNTEKKTQPIPCFFICGQRFFRKNTLKSFFLANFFWKVALLLSHSSGVSLLERVDSNSYKSISLVYRNKREIYTFLSFYFLFFQNVPSVKEHLLSRNNSDVYTTKIGSDIWDVCKKQLASLCNLPTKTNLFSFVGPIISVPIQSISSVFFSFFLNTTIFKGLPLQNTRPLRNFLEISFWTGKNIPFHACYVWLLFFLPVFLCKKSTGYLYNTCLWRKGACCIRLLSSPAVAGISTKNKNLSHKLEVFWDG